MEMSATRPRERTRVLREGSWVSFGQIAALAGRVVGLRLVTELIAPAAFTELTLLLGLATLGSNLFCAGILQGALRFYPDADRDGHVGSLRGILKKLLVWSTAAVVALLLLGGAVWSGFMGGRASLLSFLFTASVLVVDVVRTFETNLLNAARKQKTFALWNAVDAWARPLVAAAALLVFGPSAASALLGYTIGTAAANLVFARTIVRGVVARRPDAAWESRMRDGLLRYAAPFVPLAILGWLMSLGDRYILAGLKGAEVAGLYSAVYGLGSQPFIGLAGIVATTLRPVLFEASARNDRRKERRTLAVWLGTVTVGSAVGVLLTAVLSGRIVRIFLAKDYWGSAPLLPWIAAAYALQGIQQSFEALIYAHRKTERILFMQVAGTIAAILLQILLIPRLGALGAAMAALGSLAISCLTCISLSGALNLLIPRAAESP